MDDIIIFGAGKTAVKIHNWAIFAGYRVLFFVDNDSAKWGKSIQDKPIYSPGILSKYNCSIVFQDVYKKEIEMQLNKMPYYGCKMTFTQLIKGAVCRKDADIKLPEVYSDRKISFVFDAYFSGLNWGGVESWSCTVAKGLSDLNVNTCLICGTNRRFDDYVDNCLHFYDQEEVALVKKMATKIIECLPCIFISHASIALYAACIVKSMFPDQIKLIVVAHGDEENTYRTLGLWSDQIERIVCISKKIYNEFQVRYGFGEEILLYHPNPVQISTLPDKERTYGDTLRIGFAARLRKAQKRAHLLPDIIEACARRNVDVEFNIAGEGECLELLQAYVLDKHLDDKVHILGWLPPTDMADFWRRQDIYLNISDFEGMSLAMLEAMSQGCVPVVTDVSGVRDVIEDGENGFVIPIENWLEAVDKIEIISKGREAAQKASDFNKKIIRTKYNVCDYARWMMETFHF